MKNLILYCLIITHKWINPSSVLSPDDSRAPRSGVVPLGGLTTEHRRPSAVGDRPLYARGRRACREQYGHRRRHSAVEVEGLLVAVVPRDYRVRHSVRIVALPYTRGTWQRNKLHHQPFLLNQDLNNYYYKMWRITFPFLTELIEFEYTFMRFD